MRKILTLFVMILATAGILSAQTQKFPYQAVVRNADTLVHDTEIPMTVSIYNGDVNTPVVYVETHNPTSTKNGLVSVFIGGGNVQSGSFYMVDWSIATIKVDYEVGGNTLTNTIPVRPVPYAIQAGGERLTTDMIADYLQDSLTYNDVTEILQAIVANPTGLKDTLKNALIEYLKTHTDIPKAVAEGYLQYLDGNDLRTAQNTMYANTPVRAQLKADLIDFIKNNKEMAKEVLIYYLQHVTAADVDSVNLALHQMPFPTRQEFKDLIVNYIKAHRTLAQQFLINIVTTAEGSDAAALYNHFKQNNSTVWIQFVDSIHVYVQEYIANEQPQGLAGSDSAYVANLLHQTISQHHYIPDTCNPSVDLCDLMARINTLVNTLESTDCIIFGPTSKVLTPNGLTLTNTWTGNIHYATNLRYVITDADNNVKAIMLATVDGTQLSAYANPDQLENLYHLAPGQYTATPTAHQPTTSCDSTGTAVTFVIPKECPTFNTNDFDVIFSTNSANNDQFELSFPIDLDDLGYNIPLVSFNNVNDPNDFRNIQLEYDATNKRITGTFNIASLGTSSDPGGYGKTYKVTPEVKVKCDYHDEGQSDTTLIVSPVDFQFTMPIQCPSFSNTKDSLSLPDRDRVAFYSDIQTTLANTNTFFYVIDGTDTLTVQSAFDNYQVYTMWFDTLDFAGKTLSFYPTIDVKCGYDTNAYGYTTVVGPEGTVTFAATPVCPTYSTPEVISAANGLRDTVAIQVANFDANMLNSIEIRVGGVNIPYVTYFDTANAIAFIDLGDWTDPNARAIFGINPGESATRDIEITTTSNTASCVLNNQNIGTVTIDLPACPAFAGTPTATLNANDGTMLASFPVSDYNESLLNSAVIVTVYRNTASHDEAGDQYEMGPATYNSVSQCIEYTIDSLTVASYPGARYDFIANMTLTSYCDPNTSVESNSVFCLATCPDALGATTKDQLAGNDTVVFHTLTPNINDGVGGYAIYVMNANNQWVNSDSVIPATVANGEMVTDAVDFYRQFDAKFNGKDLQLHPYIHMSLCTNTIEGAVFDHSVAAKCPTFGNTNATIDNGIVTITCQIENYNPALVDNNVYPLSKQNNTVVDYPNNPGTISSTGLIEATLPVSGILTEGLKYSFAIQAELTGDICAQSVQTIFTEEVCIPYSSNPSIGTSNYNLNDLSLTVNTEINDYEASRMHDQGFILLTENNNPVSATATVSNNTMENVFTLDGQLRGTTVKVVPFIEIMVGCDNNTYSAVYGDTIALCIPYASKPTFTTVKHTSGQTKQTLFGNEGVILTTKINDFNSYANLITKRGYLLSREPITEYNPDLYQVIALDGISVGSFGANGDSLIYTVGIDSCGDYVYYRPFVLLDGCDSVVLGGSANEKFTISFFDFTVSSLTDPVSGLTTLTADATMTVNSWGSYVSSYNSMRNYFKYGCNDPADACYGTTNCYEACSSLPEASENNTQPMETWMELLSAVYNCCTSWNAVEGPFTQAFGVIPGQASFKYVWEGPNFSNEGKTYLVNPTSPTTYTGYSIFTYNGVQCVLKQNVTVGQ